MAWYTGLTEEQKVAAAHFGSHARLLAGPGTGKTRTLTTRIAYLVQEMGVPADRILALTFTRMAAFELRSRLATVFGLQGTMPDVSTLHSYALRSILRNHARVRLPSPIRITDDYEDRWIVQEDLKNLLQTDVERVRELLALLSSDWEQLRADASERSPDPRFLAAWREHRGVYGYTLRDELVYQLCLALGESSLIVDPSPAHVLIDEYQDLNPCDLAVVNSIVASGAELYCAGDDDQSIYGFRHADPDGIRRFAVDYTPNRLLELNECHRCSPGILTLAQYVADQDPRRIAKRTRCVAPPSFGEVKLLRFRDQNAECRAVARISKWLVDEQSVAPDQIMVLLRSDRNGAFSSPLMNAFAKLGLPASVAVDPLKPLNWPRDDSGQHRPEGRRVLSILRLLANPGDSLAWRTWLGLANGIGTVTLSAVYDVARHQGITFEAALRRIVGGEVTVPRVGDRIRSEYQRVTDMLAAWHPSRFGDVVELVESLVQALVSDTAMCAEVSGVFQKAFRAGGADSLDSLLKVVGVSLGDKEQEQQTGSISVMTMHQAKGLDAEAVFLPAVEDQYLPGRATGMNQDDERRLLYVSITRAKHFLYVSFCNQRFGPQQHTGSAPDDTHRDLSRFLSGGPMKPEDGVRFVRDHLGV